MVLLPPKTLPWRFGWVKPMVGLVICVCRRCVHVIPTVRLGRDSLARTNPLFLLVRDQGLRKGNALAEVTQWPHTTHGVGCCSQTPYEDPSSVPSNITRPLRSHRLTPPCCKPEMQLG